MFSVEKHPQLRALTASLSRTANLATVTPWTYVLAVALPIAAGLIAQAMTVVVGTDRISFVFMSSVLVAGALLGIRGAIVAAVIAFGIFNFFLVEPRFSLRLASADDFVALVLFLGAALLTGGLAGRLRDQTTIAARQLRATQGLFEASQRLSQEVEAPDVHKTLADLTARTMGSPAVVVAVDAGEPRSLAAAPPDYAPAESDLRAIAALLRAGAGADERWIVAPIRSGSAAAGALAVNAQGGAEQAGRAEALGSLATLGAIALERGALMADTAHARGLAESERLRNALLASLSHDLRTPLATMLASVTSLIDYSDKLDGAAKLDLLKSIREETERMSRFVSNLLEMTRLEAGLLHPKVVRADVTEVVSDAAAHVARPATLKRLSIVQSGDPISVPVDPVLLEQALLNLLENAIAFSPEGARIEIDVRPEGSFVAISVTDQGPGVPPEIQAHIFEKFYRGPDSGARRLGVGLGLSIARALVEALGGSIEIQSPLGGDGGARFVIRLRA